MSGLRSLALGACLAAACGPAWAAEPAPDVDPRWAVHAQVTDIFQYHPAFASAFQGDQSFDHHEHTGNTVDFTLYLGVRPWTGAEVWLEPETYQGIAPNDVLGIAGYVNGDGAKVGKVHPYTRIARAFVRQTVDLGPATEDGDADLDQFGGKQAKDRMVFTAGKLNATDIFDTNKYAHNPRADFLNWSLIDAGSYDYAADAWGYTYGAAAEWYRGDWTFRLGLFDMSIVPNNKTLTPDLSQFQYDAEVERRFALMGRPGAARATLFVDRAEMGTYVDAVALAAATRRPADTALVRRYRSRPGGMVNVEQEIADGVGVFARAGWDDGTYESYEYTDIDRTLQAGIQVGGKRWGRKDDTVGVAGVVNAISAEHQAYLNAGGLGILVGDGKLPHPGDERIIEAYYSLALGSITHLSVDYQFIANPAYNRDRGPVHVLGLRLHLQK